MACKGKDKGTKKREDAKERVSKEENSKWIYHH